MEWFLAICTGIALSAACGLRVFAPFFVLSFAVKFLGAEVPDGLMWLSSWTAFGCLCVAMMTEMASYYIPWIDNVLDVISTPLALVGGALMMGGALDGVPPYVKWALAAVAGSGTAGVLHLGMLLVRATSTVVTGGAGNHVVATGENTSAIGVTVLSVVFPVIAIVVVIALVAIVTWVCCKGRRKRQKAVLEA